MTSALATTFILAGISALILGVGRFVRPLAKPFAIAGLVWLAAALPVMFFLNLNSRYVLLFYLLSAAVGLILHFGGKPA